VVTHVDDETFDRMTARSVSAGVVEYTMFITILWMTMRQFSARPEDYTDEAILALIDECEPTGRRWPTATGARGPS